MIHKDSIVVHVPHSSTNIPYRYKSLFQISENELKKELITMTDLFVDCIFQNIGDMIRFPMSRLLCDVERFRNPALEEMTKSGMWICYEKTSSGKMLKRLNKKHIQEMLFYYDRHHQILERKIAEYLNRYGEALIIDAHSFPSKEQPYELHKGAIRPDICIGADDFHTPEEMIDSLRNHFESYGLSVGINTPFCGTIVPMKYYHKNKHVRSVMIEINKSLYVNEEAGLPKNLWIKNVIVDYFRNSLYNINGR